ncbi:MAG: bifunctional hydroxymethylpyrimidine kinase/phosphomethylpyrimidine kinase [Acidobacteria bacterium]|nr:bifunctional hydroxymethylpyrimidine kinase/phosphomethylpyrimidine kinase [Acidobacteriota bacterium]
MIDRFIVGRVTRISPEAPVPIVRFESEYVRLGGAANVAHNLAVLGARASLIGIVGDDAAGRTLRAQLTAAGVNGDGLVVDPDRPTTEKVRVVTERNQQVARIDYEQDTDASGAVESAIIDAVRHSAPDAKALLVSDYLKGAITRPVIEVLQRDRRATLSGERPPLIVDPKIPHLSCYAGATIVTPNHHEAEVATHIRIRNDDDAHAAARAFRDRARCEAVLITRGEQGMWLSEPAAEGSIPAVAREVADVTGAGDTVVATLALALAAGATMTEAAMLANQAAGIVVGKFGPATVTREELIRVLSA